MKRVIVVLLLLSLAFFSFASDVRVFTAYGEGATENDAKERAVSALAEMVFPVFFKVESETNQYSEENNGSVTEDTFSTSSKTKISVVGEFPHFEYEVVSYSNDVFLVRAEIKGDEETLDFYKGRADNERKSIVGIYSRYKESENHSGSTRELIEALDNVLEHYPVYKLYRDIFVNLGGESASIALPDDFPTYDLLQYDKRALKIKEQNEISAESFSYELEERIEKNKAEQEALKLAQKENREMEKLQNEMETGLALKDAAASFDDEEESGNSTGLDLDGFRECFGVVMRANYNLSELLDLYESKREEEAKKIEKSFEEGKNAIETRPYPSGLVDYEGNPTSDALKIRKMEIAELREEKDKEKEDIYKIIDESLCAVIQEKYDYFISAVRLLEKKKFHLSSKEGDFSHYLPSKFNYDGEKQTWYSKLTIAEPFLEVEQDVRLTYNSVTGNTIPLREPARLKYLASERYNSEIDEYTKILKASNLESTLTFSVTFDESTGLVKCRIRDLYVKIEGRNCLIDGFYPIITYLDAGKVEWRDLSSYSWLETEETRAQAEKEAARKAEAEEARKKQAEEEAATKKEEEEKALAPALLEEEIKSEETEKSVTVETIEVKRTKEKESVKLSFYLDVRTFLTFGGSYDERTSGAFEIKVEPDLFVGGNFFFGAALYLSVLYPDKSAFSTNAEYTLLGFQAALMPSIGVKLFERAALSLRMGIVNGSSFLIAPDIAIDLYDHSNKSAMPLVISGGCMVNTSTGKVSFSIGFGAFGPL